MKFRWICVRKAVDTLDFKLFAVLLLRNYRPFGFMFNCQLGLILSPINLHFLGFIRPVREYNKRKSQRFPYKTIDTIVVVSYVFAASVLNKALDKWNDAMLIVVLVHL